MRQIDITGQRFGKLVALAFTRSILQGSQKRQYWLFRCDCGVEREIQKGTVTGGAAVSCGCHRQANFTKANEARRLAAIVGQPTSTRAPERNNLTAEQLANRAAVPSSMRSLQGRIVQARHSRGQSAG